MSAPGLNHVGFLDDGGLVLGKRNGNTFLLTLADTKYLLRALQDKGWIELPKPISEGEAFTREHGGRP